MSSEEDGCLGTVDTSSGTLPSTDSQKLSSSKSNSNSNSHSTDSQNGMLYDAGFKGLPLTKETLGRHNEEMEKEFMQQHRYSGVKILSDNGVVLNYFVYTQQGIA